MKPDTFVTLVRPAVDQRVAKGGSLVLAHAAYETGWGVAKAFVKGNNLFNITRLPTDPLPIVRAGDIEVGKDGSRRKIIQRFAAYRDIGESVEHYLRFINRDRYKPALDCIAAEDIGGFVTALKKGGYFTLALAEYLTGLSNVHDRVIKEMEDRG